MTSKGWSPHGARPQFPSRIILNFLSSCGLRSTLTRDHVFDKLRLCLIDQCTGLVPTLCSDMLTYSLLCNWVCRNEKLKCPCSAVTGLHVAAKTWKACWQNFFLAYVLPLYFNLKAFIYVILTLKCPLLNIKMCIKE